MLCGGQTGGPDSHNKKPIQVSFKRPGKDRMELGRREGAGGGAGVRSVRLMERMERARLLPGTRHLVDPLQDSRAGADLKPGSIHLWLAL